MIRRPPAVAGQFYPGSKSSLLETLEKCFLNKKFGPGELPTTQNLNKRTIIGGVSPHAGYSYSGNAAAHTYLHLFKEKIPDTVIILGTDHVGYGKIALMKEGFWETPLGEVKIDTELATAILKTTNSIIDDKSAFTGPFFSREHNIEVQLPFIQFCSGEKDVQLVPIIVSSHNYNTLEQISHDIANVIKTSDKDVIIVASSDMTHKEIHNAGNDLENFKKLDQAVIDAFSELDPIKTFKNARKTTVCGSQTISALLLTCKFIECNTARVLKYYTSYEKSGSLGYCVGYFSGIITK